MTALKKLDITTQSDLAIAQSLAPNLSKQSNKSIFQKIKGGILLTVGYLLSPLCWWNDLIINLPIAYGFDYMVRLWQAD